MSRDDLAANDDSLNIRRYADNAPPAEPHDVRAHLYGGVPRAEVDTRVDLFTAHGFTTDRVFVDRDESYWDFADGITKAEFSGMVANHPGVLARETELRDAVNRWWDKQVPLLVGLSAHRPLMEVRKELLNSFVRELVSVGLLDRFQLAGVIVRWWDTIQYDLRTLIAHGFTGVIDGWVTTITTAIDDKIARPDPLDHKLVSVLLPSFLDELAVIEAKRRELDALIRAGSSVEEDEGDETGADDADLLSPTELAKFKKDLAAIKKKQKILQQEFIAKLDKSRTELTAVSEQALVLHLLRQDLTTQLDRYTTTHRGQIVDIIEGWWAKYAMSLRQIEAIRDAAATGLARILCDLGYE